MLSYQSFPLVLHDLKVLEQQQLESQRQLDSIKQVKRCKIEQKADWNRRLSNIKFSNGEENEKVDRARKDLSVSAHFLNGSRRTGQSFIENLRHVDSRLKQVVGLFRFLQAKRRRADCDVMAIRHVHLRIARSKIDLEKRCCDLLTKRDNIKDDEKNMTDVIRNENNLIRRLSDESAEWRKLQSELELSLTREQQGSVALKASIDSLNLDMDNAKKRHLETIIIERDEVKRLNGFHGIKIHEIHNLRVEINDKSEECIELWNKFLTMQPLCIDYPRSHDTVSSFVLMERSRSKSLELTLAKDVALLNDFDILNETMNLEAITSDKLLVEKIKAAKTVHETTEYLNSRQIQRKENNQLTYIELESKRSEVESCELSYFEMKRQFDDASFSFRDKRNGQRLLITSRKKYVQETLLEVEEQSKILENLKEKLHSDQREIAKRRDCLSIELSKNRTILSELDSQRKSIRPFEAPIHDENEVDLNVQELEDQIYRVQTKVKEKMKCR
jgi:hypothetical protein